MPFWLKGKFFRIAFRTSAVNGAMFMIAFQLQGQCLAKFLTYTICGFDLHALQEEWDGSGAQVTLFAGQPGALGDAAHDEELYTYKNRCAVLDFYNILR